MDISLTELKALLQKSGNRCAFPTCGEVLLHDRNDFSDPVILSKVAHIVAKSQDGPRGKYPLPLDERNKENNLILLCAKHHDIIDQSPQYYTVERLRQIKDDHEALVLNSTGDAISKRANKEKTSANYLHEVVYSTLFQVADFPKYVYCSPCAYTDQQKDEIKDLIVWPKDKSEMFPYVIRGEQLYAFQDLTQPRTAFREIIDPKKSQRFLTADWENDPVKGRWLITLLNRSLNKLTGRKGLFWDKDHKRYYFHPDEPGTIKEVRYRPLNQALSSKQVVWQPISKQTGEPRPYWLHRAVSLKFHLVTSSQWCLSIRPEFRVTKDGVISEESDKIGSRVTRKKSKMFNYDLLGEVNFWRDFLSDSQPRIILNFGKDQHLIVSTTMMQADVDWPGIPEKYAKPFKNVEYVEDLFSWAKLNDLNVDFDDESDEADLEADDEWGGEDGKE